MGRLRNSSNFNIPEELLDIIDIDNRIIGQASKNNVHEKGLRHRVSAVILRRFDSRYLFPTASILKVEAGKLFHSVAGHVNAGESYKEAAIRELSEECGVKADNVRSLGHFWFEKNYSIRKEKERFEVFQTNYSRSMGLIKLNREQINEKWLSIPEMKVIYNNEMNSISDPLRLTCEIIFHF